MKINKMFAMMTLASFGLNMHADANKIIGGYMTTSWGNDLTVSQAVQNGYNTVIFAFADIIGGDMKWDQGILKGYGGWQSPPSPDAVKSDIAAARNSGLKHVLVSVGGANNTFAPANADPHTLAQTTVAFLQNWGLDGIDFDLEGIPGDVTPDYMFNFISALKSIWPSIIISGAPQVNNVGGKLDYVNTGTQQVYKKAIDAGLFDMLMVQTYNTGGNFVSKSTGAFCSGQSGDCVDETSPEFWEAAFKSLKQITPAKTLIVLGQPATAGDGGQGTIFYGAEANGDVYQLLAASFNRIGSDPQAGGVFTWSINDQNGDMTNGYKFAKAMAQINSGAASKTKPTPAPGPNPSPAPGPNPSPTPGPTPSPTPGPNTSPANCAPWSPATVYTAGQCAMYNNQQYIAQYWTQNNTPKSSYAQGDPWKANGAPQAAPAGATPNTQTPAATPSAQTTPHVTPGAVTQPCAAWNNGTAYKVGQCAMYNNQQYIAQIATQGSVPQSTYKTGNPWKLDATHRGQGKNPAKNPGAQPAAATAATSAPAK